MRLALVLAVCVACSNGAKKHDDARSIPTQQEASVAPATAKVWLTGAEGEVPVSVEVVDTPPKIMKGLMYREHLPLDAGMLFLMAVMNDGKEDDQTFYMRNTLIPLDMIFINKDLTIVGIVKNAEPRTETLRSVGMPSLYVLEVNGGWTAAKKIQVGSKVRFEGVTPSPSP